MAALADRARQAGRAQGGSEIGMRGWGGRKRWKGWWFLWRRSKLDGDGMMAARRAGWAGAAAWPTGDVGERA